MAYPGELSWHIEHDEKIPITRYTITYTPLDYDSKPVQLTRRVTDAELVGTVDLELFFVVLASMMQEEWNAQQPDMQITFKRHQDGFELRWKDDAAE